MQRKIISILLLIFVCISCVRPSSVPEDSVPDEATGVDQTDVLIYGGPGSWRNEINALKEVLYNHGATYQEVKPAELNSFSKDDFKKYKAILFAGGDAPTVRRALNKDTRALIREAVQSEGLNYLGYCAGAWLAVAPEPDSSGDTIYGIGVVPGPIQKQTFLYNRGLPNSLDEAYFPNGSRRKLLWYGGPITPEIPGSVAVRYSDGTPAISQIHSGRGLVLISGLHPAVTKDILSSLGLYEKEAVAPDFAWAMFEAVIRNRPLPTF